MIEAGDGRDRPRLLRHIVLFSYKEGVGAAEKAELVRRFSGLPALIPAVHAFECGRNNSPEGLARGFEEGFLVTFLNEADRDIYLPHPAHKEFVAFIAPYVRDALVFDYWA